MEMQCVFCEIGKEIFKNEYTGLRFWRQTAIISINNLKWVVLVMEMQCVFCEIDKEIFKNDVYINFRIPKGPICSETRSLF